MKRLLNSIQCGIKKVLKSLKFNFQKLCHLMFFAAVTAFFPLGNHLYFIQPKMHLLFI